VAGAPYPPPVLERLAALAEAEPEREVCGLVVERDGVCEVWPARNAAPDPADGFEIAPAEVLAALARLDAAQGGLRAIYHSHPRGGAGLSSRDRGALTAGEGPLFPGVDLLVLALDRGRVVAIAAHRWGGWAFSRSDLVFSRGRPD
jgi:proteasome lid subunit RPN8/RPN11